MDPVDLKSLEGAVEALENPTWAMRVVNLIGLPIEAATKLLPAKASAIVSRATTIAVRKALVAAVSTMGKKHRAAPSKWLHRAAVAGSGGVGGFFGLPGIAVELPISTALMLRAIADIARSEGEDVGSVGGQLACVQVFALGGPGPADDASETAYYAVRVGLAKALSEAAEYIAAKGITEEGAPVVVRLIARIAARFDVVVSEKVAAQAVPVVGAATGAAINLLFVNSFQKIASGHFVVRRLERKYGLDVVKSAYETIAT
ncbi:MAG: EcsC family protein, partial [Thermoanaerobaculales bacterium]